MTQLKPRGKNRRTHIYTKGEDQTDKYIYYKVEQHDPTKTKGKDQTDKYIYYKIKQHDSTKTKVEGKMDKYIYYMLFNLIVYIFVRLIFPLSIYMCPSDLPPRF
jgi:hypothetical protein